MRVKLIKLQKLVFSLLLSPSQQFNKMSRGFGGTFVLWVLFELLLVSHLCESGRTKTILLYTSLAAPLPNWHLGRSNTGDRTVT